MVYRIFTPSREEIENANQVLGAYQEGMERQTGVISLNGKMIDAPMVTRAERILAYAAAVNGQGRD